MAFCSRFDELVSFVIELYRCICFLNFTVEFTCIPKVKTDVDLSKEIESRWPSSLKWPRIEKQGWRKPH